MSIKDIPKTSILGIGIDRIIRNGYSVEDLFGFYMINDQDDMPIRSDTHKTVTDADLDHDAPIAFDILDLLRFAQKLN